MKLDQLGAQGLAPLSIQEQEVHEADASFIYFTTKILRLHVHIPDYYRDTSLKSLVMGNN